MDKTQQTQSKDKSSKFEKAVHDYPGMAVDVADKEKVDPKMVKQRTKTLNDNPRDNQQP